MSLAITHHAPCPNTMALDCTASQMLTIDKLTDLDKLPNSDLPFFVLSGGSNVLLPSHLNALVLHPNIQSLNVISDSSDSIIIDVGAGINWHRLVMHCTQNGWYGLENLALIPGLAGAAPIQNIGAYGVEIKDCLLGVATFDLIDRRHHYFDQSDCDFAYRHSIFKDTHKHHFITAIRLMLHKNPKKITADYGDLYALASTLAKQDNQPLSPKYIMQAVIHIRQAKLPNPFELPNCGSFFKNPIIPLAQFKQLQHYHPNLPHYPQTTGDTITHIKLPAGWLIEQVGLKGKGIAPILTHHKQALVLTNHAPQHATQADVLATQTLVEQSVYDQFGIQLTREPVLVASDGSF